jgi:hypothetical protein
VVVDVVADVGAEAVAAIDLEAQRVADWLGDVRVRWRYPTARTKRLSA